MKFANIFGSTRTNTKEDSVLDFLNKTISHKNWFIAGSFAINVNAASDCDIFFKTEEDFNQAVQDFKLQRISVSFTTHASNTYKVMDAGASESVQLVKTRFGTVDEILDGFDLTCCMRAILPNGNRYQGSLYHNHVNIIPENAGLDTIKRYDKYTRVRCYQSDHSSLVRTFDYMIDNYDKPLKNYYTGKMKTFAENLLDCSQNPTISLILMHRIDAKLDPEKRLAFYRKYLYDYSDFQPNPMLSPEYHGVLAEKTGIPNDIAMQYYPELCI